MCPDKRTVVLIHIKHATFAPIATPPANPPRMALPAANDMISLNVFGSSSAFFVDAVDILFCSISVCCTVWFGLVSFNGSVGRGREIQFLILGSTSSFSKETENKLKEVLGFRAFALFVFVSCCSLLLLLLLPLLSLLPSSLDAMTVGIMLFCRSVGRRHPSSPSYVRLFSFSRRRRLCSTRRSGRRIFGFFSTTTVRRRE